MSDFVVAQIRTYVPIAIGWVLTRLAEVGIVDIDGEAVIGASVLIVSALWYALFGWLERRVSSKFGWALGYAKAPDYELAA